MGVKNLWKLLEPAGRPIRLESLEDLILAVDVSIWLNQAVKGMRTRGGEPVPHAHLIVLFNRVCKLLYHRVKPVFVFDGATPALKQKTLEARHRKRARADERSSHAASKQTSKYLQAKILEQITGEKSRVPIPLAVQSRQGGREVDMFELPPLPENALQEEDEPHENVSHAELAGHYYADVATLDIQSDSFDSLPPDVQHELLLERQQVQKYSYHNPATLPQEASDFSNYQLSRLLERSRTSKKLQDVRKVLKTGETALVGLGEESQVHEVETNRIMGSKSSHYILVKGADIESQSSASQTDEDALSQSDMDGPVVESCSRIGATALDSKGGSHHSEVSIGGIRSQREVDGVSVSGEPSFVATSASCSMESLLSDSDEGEVDYIGSLEGQLTLFEDLKTSTNRKGLVQGTVTGDDVEALSSSLLTSKEVPVSSATSVTELPTCSTKPPSSPTSKEESPSSLTFSVKPPLSPTCKEPPSSPTSIVKSPASNVKPPTSKEAPSSPITDVKLPSSPTSKEPPSSSISKEEPPTPNVKPPSSPTSKELPSPSSLLIPNVKPPSSPTSKELLSPSSPLTPNVKPPSSPTSDELPSPSSLLTPNVKPPSSPTSKESPSSSIEPSIEIASAKTKPAEPSVQSKLTSQQDLKVAPSSDLTPVAHTEPPDESSGESGSEFVVVEGDDGTVSKVGSPEEERVWSGGEELDALVNMEAGAAQEMLVREAEQLERERSAQSRAASAVSNQMYKDAQELLSLFGLPYLVAPGEAEAQCAALEELGLTEGSITDDSDIFLFGGQKVYRNFFAQDKDLEVYHESEIEKSLGLSRDKLIVLSYLLGSDYTEGIEGVGVVSAMELLRDFPGTALQPLDKLKTWHEEVNLKPPLAKHESGMQKKLRQSYLGPEFPDRAVWDAYMQPEVDKSEETFDWGHPHLDLLRGFAVDRIGWKQEKVNEMLLPVLKKMNAKPSGQAKLTQFFPTAHVTGTPPTGQLDGGQGRAIRSKRLRCAITRIKGQSSDGCSSSEDLSSQGKRQKPAPRRKRTPVKKGKGKDSKTVTGGGGQRRGTKNARKSALSASSSDSD